MRASVTLEDRYVLEDGFAVVSGTQALVLLMILQRRMDRQAGLNTAGFCSGYRGSPLSTLDQEFHRAQKVLDPLGIRFHGGVNEALAATAVHGTQMLHLDPLAEVDGVFGMWFGKGAGLDQSIDVMRHANNAGTAPHGGVLAVVGDDHALKSSALAHHCEPTFADLRIPVLYPCDIEETLRFGLLGYAMSRYSGSWVGLKTLPEVVNSSAVVGLRSATPPIHVPPDEEGARNPHIRWPDPWPAGEIRFHQIKWQRILKFLRLNDLNRVIVQSEQPRLGIITAGKSYLDVVEALRHLGLTLSNAAERGISIYKVGCPWPLEPHGAVEFAEQHPALLVVEEKRDFIEAQLKTLLFEAALSRPPVVHGRSGPDGQPLLAGSGELSPEGIAVAIAKALGTPAAVEGPIATAAAQIVARERAIARLIAPVGRGPFFCSGCPHNTSTKVPEGSRAMAGIGCHGMAMFGRDGRTAWHTHMGGEGATWIGHSPFTSMEHIFQNIGDGTYHHSGSLALRAAVSAGLSITYKILYNDAVAMTGGQAIDGRLNPLQLVEQLRAEGIERIALLSDDPAQFERRVLPKGTTVHHRDALEIVQRELRRIRAVTALVYVQTCATEKRRRRKRGLAPEPQLRIFIDPQVCEGCGDCSAKSNCLSVVPVETELGRKRRIDQSACNKDISCTKGFCPSFVVLQGARIPHRGEAAIRQLAPRLATLPAPPIEWNTETTYNILCTGIGGTGVVTIGALIAMAAHIAGLSATVHDRMGMAQKFGAVTSHIRIARSRGSIDAVRIPLGKANAVLGCDLMVTAQQDVLRTIGAGTTRVVLNTDESAPGAFVQDPDFNFHSEALLSHVEAATAPGVVECLAATALASALAGDAIGTNVFMLGYALQRGLVPVPLAALEKAIELNNVAVANTKQTLALGRLAAIDMKAVKDAVLPMLLDHERDVTAPNLETLIGRRKALLIEYQGAAYAQRYVDLIGRVQAREQEIAPGRAELTTAVAKAYFKVLAYKDEYEVARLYSSPEFRQRLAREFVGPYKVKFLLAPPLLARRDPLSGEPRKITFGAWIRWPFRLLAALKFLRGTPFDPFGYSADRKLERRLITQYESTVAQSLAKLTKTNHGAAVVLLSLAERIRGFGHVKERNYEEIMAKTAALMKDYGEEPEMAEHDRHPT